MESPLAVIVQQDQRTVVSLDIRDALIADLNEHYGEK